MVHRGYDAPRQPKMTNNVAHVNVRNCTSVWNLRIGGLYQSSPEAGIINSGPFAVAGLWRIPGTDSPIRPDARNFCP
jgi:hypothetical protein